MAFPSYAVLLQDSFAKKRPTAVIRSDMEDGMTKQLRTKSRVLVPRTVKYGFPTLANYQDFITWFEDTIDYGADWFNWIDPEDGVTKLARIAGGQLTDETPDTPTLTYWIVSFTLETWSNG